MGLFPNLSTISSRTVKRACSARRLDYSKWDKFADVDENGDLPEPPPADLAARRAQAEEAARSAERRSGHRVIFSTYPADATAPAAAGGDAAASTSGGGGGGVGAPVTIIAGYGETAEGLEDALMTMRRGERALVTVRQADYGFAAHDGPPPHPGLPAEGTVVLDVTLLEISKGREHWNLSAEEKVKYAGLKRERGNAFFKAGNYRRALKLYQPVVSSFLTKMPQRPSEAAKAARLSGQKVSGPAGYATALQPAAQGSEESEEERELKVKLQLPCLLNIAACRSKLGEHKAAIEACDKALALDSSSVKALYRRGQARIAICLYSEAREDLSKILSLDPENSDAIKALSQLQALENKVKAKERKAFGGIFASAPPDPSAARPDPNAELAAAVEASGGKKAVVKGTRTFSLVPDVAPKVRIAGVYGGDGGSDGDD